MRNLLVAVVALSCAVSASAAESLESVRAASALSMPSATALKALTFKRALRAEVSQKPPVQAQDAKGSKLITATGYLTLSGSGMVNGAFASVPVSGWVNLSGSDGPISGSVYMTGTAMMNVSGTWASGWVQPSAYVNIYDGGKLLGTMLVQGNIYVSGMVNGTWISVNGSGSVSGQMWTDQ